MDSGGQIKLDLELGAAPSTQIPGPRLRFRQFGKLLRAFFASQGGKRARILLFALLAFSFAVAGVQVLMSYAGRDFMTAVADRNEAGYWRHLSAYLGTFALAVPLGVFYRYTEQRLALLWRQWMAQHLIKRYFFNRAYYRLRDSDVVDNPDQRISEDVRNFTTGTLSYLLICLNSLVTLVAFIGVLWSISGTLVTVLFAYAAVGTALSILIGRRLVGLHYHQYEREANLRYGLIRVRDNAESIAFYRGEKREHRDLIWRLGDVVKNTLGIIGWNRNLAFFTNSYNYAAIILPILVVAPMYMRGEVHFGVITQAGGAFAQVLAALSLIITQFDGLSAFAAGVVRLGTLWDSLDEFDAEELREDAESQIEVDENLRRLVLDQLTVRTPDGTKTLVKDLSLELRPGQSLLLMGESGAGKSSLLRTIAGLWQSGEGSIGRPALRDLMFLPQRPYLMPGTLREQLMYPQPDSHTNDDDLRAILEQVNLTEVLDRVDGNFEARVDWANVLSLGEQQRLSFARLLLKHPRLAFLDEATSALDEPNERRLYETLRDSSIAYISVGHRSSLKKFHDRLMTLKRDGTWRLTAKVADPRPA
jgi:vitamin B12/bleomycin/antimicrobial peptide transport system ATP-binding/permease protein